MIDFYAWRTPNGRKVAIMLAETKTPHRIHPIDITKGEQHDPAFLAISPNNKIPAIVDHQVHGRTVALFESGAILTYLAQRSGMLLAADQNRWTELQWLHWSIGGLGPMLGQLNYFVNHADAPVPSAIERYTMEAKRLLGVLEMRLARSFWIGGQDYSIADIVSFPWLAEAREALDGVLSETFAKSPALRDWYDRVAERPAVATGMAVLENTGR